MRPRLCSLRLVVAVLLLAAGVVPLLAATPGPTANPCSDACPGDDGCDGDDARCGCCARVAPAVVPMAVAASGSPRAQAPASGDPTVTELAVVDRLLDPPRLPVS